MKPGNNLRKENKKTGVNIGERIKMIENQLKKLSSELACKEELIQIFAKETSDAYAKLVNAELVFLLEEGEENASKTLGDWLGVQEDQIYLGNGLSINHGKLALDFKLYHYDDKPVRRVSDVKPVMKIIIYSDAYSKREDFELILKELAIDTPCCVLISLKENDLELNTNKSYLYTQSLYVLNFGQHELNENGFVDLLASDEFKSKLKLIKWFNRINDLSLAGDLMNKKLQSQRQLLVNEHLLNQKELLKYQSKESEISTKNIGTIKGNITKGYKSVYRIVEQLKNELERKGEDSFIDEMKRYVDQHDKFVEDKKGKNTILQIPEGVLNNVVQKTVNKVQKDFTTGITGVKEKMNLIEKEIQQEFKELALSSPVLPSKNISESLTNEVVSEHMVLEKKYERSMTPKGMSHLFSEIRTPLFMIMPLMMFVGIFGSFFISEDVGSISKDTEYNGRNAIVIDVLPEKYKEKGFKSFAENYIFGRTGKRVLSKPDEEKGAVFQLAMREERSRKKIGNKYKTEVKMKNDYIIDKKNKRLILFLKSPEGDRSWVETELLNPENSLLYIADSGGGGGGMGMLYGLGAVFGKYRFIVLGIIVAAFSWFINSKMKEFKSEAVYTLKQNKEALTKDLKSEVDRMVRKSTAVWSAGVVGHVKKQEEIQQEVVINSLNKVIGDNKQELQEQTQIVQRRASNFENEDKQNKEYHKELHQVQEDLTSMKKKFRELIHV